MAELAASIIGIVSAGTKVTLVLSQLAADVGSAGKEARMIGNEIRSFCNVVKTLGETLEKVQSSQYYAHCAEVTKDMTETSLEMFTEILNAAESMRTMSKGKGGKFGVMSRFQWALFQKPKMLILRAAIEAYKSNLALMLATLNTAEKVSRSMATGINPQQAIEDQQDQANLESLELECQASLIDLETAEKRMEEEENEDLEQEAETSSELPEVPQSIPPRNQRVDTYDGTALQSARAAIESLRSSVATTSSLDLSTIPEHALRHSQRLSMLLAEDQRRISQRWSTVLSQSSSSSIVPQQMALGRDSERSVFWDFPADMDDAQTQPDDVALRSDIARFGAWFGKKSQYDQQIIVKLMMSLRTRGISSNQPDASFDGEPRTNGWTFLAEKKLYERSGSHSSQYERRIDELVSTQLHSLASVQISDWVVIDLIEKGLVYLPEHTIDYLNSRLYYLKLDRNHISDLPRNLWRCEHLAHLQLSDNNFEVFPSAVLKIPNLERLNISKNRLQTLPDSIAKMRKLCLLNITSNNILRIPFSLAGMTNLKRLQWENNPELFPTQEDLDHFMKVTTIPNTREDIDVLRTMLVKKFLDKCHFLASERFARRVLALVAIDKGSQSQNLAADHALIDFYRTKMKDYVRETRLDASFLSSGLSRSLSINRKASPIAPADLGLFQLPQVGQPGTDQLLRSHTSPNSVSRSAHINSEPRPRLASSPSDLSKLNLPNRRPPRPLQERRPRTQSQERPSRIEEGLVPSGGESSHRRSRSHVGSASEKRYSMLLSDMDVSEITKMNEETRLGLGKGDALINVGPANDKSHIRFRSSMNDMGTNWNGDSEEERTELVKGDS